MKTSFGTWSVVYVALSVVLCANADDWPQWRGPQRDGISRETGLLKEWPKGGPKLKWQLNNVGSGYATPAVVGDRIYLMGNEGMENEFVEALAVNDGGRLWSTRVGNVGNPKQEPHFPAARSTPTVEGGRLYALGSDGDLACLELKMGMIQWQKNLRRHFGGKHGIWAYSESPLVDGDVVVCTPGGTEAALVGLNTKTGAVLWKTELPKEEEAGYSSPVVVKVGGIKQYVNVLGKGLAGVDAKSGKLLWRYEKISSRYGANIPTPVAADGYVYSAGAGTGGGLVKLTANGKGVDAEQVYFSSKLPTAIGGGVKVGEFLYGTTGQGLACVEFATGNVKWEERAFGAASLCYGDGRFYLHGENGEVGLAEATPEGYHERGRFSPPNQPKRLNEMEKAWAYPVVANGLLFIRDHNMLWCYEVKGR